MIRLILGMLLVLAAPSQEQFSNEIITGLLGLGFIVWSLNSKIFKGVTHV